MRIVLVSKITQDKRTVSPYEKWNCLISKTKESKKKVIHSGKINLFYFQLPTYLKRVQAKSSALSIHGLLRLSSDLIF